MKSLDINTEIKNTKMIMDSLMNCIQDLSIPKSERTQYYREYLDIGNYYLKLNQVK